MTLTLAASALTACAAHNDNFSHQFLRIDRAVEDARYEVILTNIIRASEHFPLSFTAITTIHGSNAVTGTLGIPSLGIGPAPAGKEYLFGPNSVGGASSTAFDQSVLQTAEFYKGLLTPLTPSTVNIFLAQGFPREVIFYLFVDHIRVRQGSQWFEYHNDPLAPTFTDFQKYLRGALELGLATEVIEQKQESARIKERLNIDNYIKIVNAKLSAHVDNKTDETVIESVKMVTQLCFNPSLGNGTVRDLHPVCGDHAHGLGHGDLRLNTPQGGDIEIVPRSTYSIFSYLGRIVAAHDQGKISLVSDEARIGSDTLLFGIAPPGSDCAIATDYRDRKVCVSQKSPNSIRVISALLQLMVLSTSANDLPLTQTIRITP